VGNCAVIDVGDGVAQTAAWTADPRERKGRQGLQTRASGGKGEDGNFSPF
jgi:hypothetical protein